MRRLALLSMMLFACNRAERDAADEHRAESSPVSPVAGEVPTPEQAASEPKKPATESAPKPTPEQLAQLRKRLATLLDEGRALTKKGDHQGGIAKYREALAIDASDVSVLGELGWAAYLSGDLELAQRTTVQALGFVRDDKRRGMLLYNLGRIEEDREHIEAAIGHYRASLLVRPGNETVEGRLAKLEKLQGALTLTAANASLAVLGRDLSDLRAACKRIETQRCDDFTLFEDDACTCAPKLVATPGVDQSWGLLQLGAENSHQAAWFPAIKTDKGWTVFSEVLYTFNPGAFGIYEEAEIRESTVEPLLDSGTQLVIRFAKSRVDRDMGINEIETEDLEGLVVCARHETGAYCTRALITAYSYKREVEFEGEDVEILGETIEHDGLFERSFTAKAEFVDGKLVVEWTQATGFEIDKHGELWGTMARAVPAGEHLLRSLLGLPG